MDNLLHIDPALMREAQRLARLRNVNLSDTVEAFIRRFINEEKKTDKEIKITPFVAHLGVDLGLPPDFDEKEAYRKHLEEKNS